MAKATLSTKASSKPTKASSAIKASSKPINTSSPIKASSRPIRASSVVKSSSRPTRASSAIKASSKPIRATSPIQATSKVTKAAPPVKASSRPTKTSSPSKASSKPTQASSPAEASSKPVKASSPAKATSGVVKAASASKGKLETLTATTAAEEANDPRFREIRRLGREGHKYIVPPGSNFPHDPSKSSTGLRACRFFLDCRHIQYSHNYFCGGLVEHWHGYCDECIFKDAKRRAQSDESGRTITKRPKGLQDETREIVAEDLRRRMPKGEVDRDEICYLSRKKNWKLSDNVLKKRLSDMALDLSNGRRDFWWTPPGPNARRMVEEERKREEEKKMNGGKEVEEEMPPWMRKKTRKSSKSKVSAVPVSTKRAIHVQQ